MIKMLGGVALGLIGGLSIGVYLLILEEEEPVLFGQKSIAVYEDFATIQGSIVGDGKESSASNNFVSITCRRATMECDMIDLQSFSHNMVMGVHRETIPITRWEGDQLTLSSKTGDPSQCNFFEIQVDDSAEQATYTRVPITDAGRCATLEQKVFNWRIDDGLGWQQMRD